MILICCNRLIWLLSILTGCKIFDCRINFCIRLYAIQTVHNRINHRNIRAFIFSGCHGDCICKVISTLCGYHLRTGTCFLNTYLPILCNSIRFKIQLKGLISCCHSYLTIRLWHLTQVHITLRIKISVNCGLPTIFKFLKIIRIKDNCYFSVFTYYRSNLIIVSVKNPTFRRYITHQLRKIIGQFTIIVISQTLNLYILIIHLQLDLCVCRYHGIIVGLTSLPCSTIRQLIR